MRIFYSIFDFIFPEDLVSLWFFGEPEFPDKDAA